MLSVTIKSTMLNVVVLNVLAPLNILQKKFALSRIIILLIFLLYSVVSLDKG
jgi:hypothetical protein